MIRAGRFLTGCALGAVAASAPSVAAAQSYLGGGSVAAGTATIVHTVDGGPGFPAQTQIVVGAAETVIEWRPVDATASGAIDFQPTGTIATFQAAAGLADYTVLNRILPVDSTDVPVAATVAFRGTTNSLLVNDPGGHIWFYSPTGIIAGPTASFDVGSLILTTDDIAFEPLATSPPSPGSIYGPGGLVKFNGTAGSKGTVDVQAGAQISATGTNAYVALVAPRVIQAGTVQANGQIAYLAAEQVDMTINGGVFDFTLTVGTTDNQGIVHSGTTTGPASTAATDVQRISMIALPKNDALTMLLSGSIGYTAAASVSDEGSAIVLGAGYATDEPAGVPNSLGSIEIGNANFANTTLGVATNDITVAPTGGTTSFANNVALFAGDSVTVTAEADEVVRAVNFLQLNAGVPAAGSSVTVRAETAGLIEAGVLSLDASSLALSYIAGYAAYNATGGTIDLTADGGTIRAGRLFADAGAQGGYDAVLGGLATGGTIDLSVANNGVLDFADIDASVFGLGGNSGATGGNGRGGRIGISDLGGQLDFGSVLLRAGGLGGGANVQSGDGQGGRAVISLTSQAQNWGSLEVNAGAGPGTLGETVSTGSATGATDAIALSISGSGALTVAGDLELSASTTMSTDGVTGFEGHAGGVQLTVGAGGRLTVGGTLSATADAIFAIEGISGTVNAPAQQGGTVAVVADGGQISATRLTVTANAVGAAGPSASGAARGGTAEVSALNGGSIAVNPLGVDGFARISADGTGEYGTPASDAFGGTARLIVRDGTFTAMGDVGVSAAGIGRISPATPTGNGINATGGVAAVELQAGALGTGVITIDRLGVRAVGDARLHLVDDPGSPGGEPIQGTAGIGSGGTAQLVIGGGTFTAGAVTLAAGGFGGTSATDGLGGEGHGGEALFSLADTAPVIGPHRLASLTIDSSGRGGAGTSGVAESDAGHLRLETNAALAIAGNLSLISAGTRAPAGAGIQVSLSGPDLLAGGDVVLNTTRDVETTGAGLRAAGALTVNGRTVSAAGPLSAGGQATIAAPGAISLAAVAAGLDLSVTSTGGPVTVTGPLAARGINLAAAGNVALASANATAALTLASSAGSLTATGALNAGGPISISAPGNVALVSAGAATALTLASTAGSLSATGALTAGGPISVTAPGPVALASAGAGTALTLASGAGSLSATGALTAGGAITVTAPGNIALASASAGTALTLASTAGSLSATGNVTGLSGDLSAAQAILISGNLALGGNLRVRGGAAFTVQGTAQAGDVDVVANGGIALAVLNSGATTYLAASNGAVTVADLRTAGRVTALGNSVDIASGGALRFDEARAFLTDVTIRTAGDLTTAILSANRAVGLTAGGALAFADLTAATGAITVRTSGSATGTNLTAGTAIELDVGGALNLAGTARGASIAVRSSDIALGSGARIGVRGTTQTVSLVNRNAATATVVGDGIETPGYRLGAAEAASLFADRSIRIGGTGNVAIGDLALSFGATGNIGAGGLLNISTPARVSIVGDVALTTSSAADTFLIDPSLIELDTLAGSIALHDAGGAPLGKLSMVGGTIAVATRPVLEALAGAPDMAAINALLDQPGGTSQPLFAGAIELSVVDGLYIQNTGESGLYRDRRGFAAEALAINTESAAARIAINGLIQTAAGPQTGLDTQRLVTLNGTPAAAGGRFDPASTINGCVIGGACAPPPGGSGPNSEELDAPLDPGVPPPAFFVAPLIELAATDPLIEPPLVDEPITGVGNDDLWQPRCAGAGEDGVCPEEGDAR